MFQLLGKRVIFEKKIPLSTQVLVENDLSFAVEKQERVNGYPRRRKKYGRQRDSKTPPPVSEPGDIRHMYYTRQQRLWRLELSASWATAWKLIIEC